ncbi:hypothetical protein LGT39_00525, partial [Demequina sp. TTPB684]|nr:hypothetical protein [Demequina sp. TTPB684]
MSQLFASPDEPRPDQGARHEPERADAYAESGQDVRSADGAPAAAASPVTGEQVFDAPAPRTEASSEYVVPEVPATATRPVPPRRGVGAVVMVVSLLLGLVGGVGGAAAWQEWGPADSASTTKGVTLPASASGTDEPVVGSVAAVAEAVLPSVVQLETTTALGG